MHTCIGVAWVRLHIACLYSEKASTTFLKVGLYYTVTARGQGLLLKLQSAMQSLSQPSPGVELLRALRPLLSEKRAKKVDDAVRIMQLVQLLPTLKESGLFRLGGDSQ